MGKGVNIIPSVGKGVTIPCWGDDDGCGPGCDPGDDCEPPAGRLTVTGVDIPCWGDDGCGPGCDPGDDCVPPPAGRVTVTLMLTSVPGATSTVEVGDATTGRGAGTWEGTAAVVVPPLKIFEVTTAAGDFVGSVALVG